MVVQCISLGRVSTLGLMVHYYTSEVTQLTELNRQRANGRIFAGSISYKAEFNDL